MTSSEDDLIRIVGTDRSRSSPEAVARAEAELRSLARSSRSQAEERLRTATRLSLLVGITSALMPFVMLQEPIGARPEPLLFVVGPWVQGVLGIALAAGGFGLWRRQRWGSVVVVLVIQAYMVVTILFHIYFAWDAAGLARGALGVVFGLLGLAFCVLWLVALQRGVSYLTEPGLASLLGEGHGQSAG